MKMDSVTKAFITKVNSDTFTVKYNNGYIDLKARGINRYKKIKPIVGDNVLINIDKKVIEKILDRKNKLDRPPVANIDIALIVTSLKSPDISLSLLDRLISIITIENVEPVIIFTKGDLGNKCEIEKLNNLYTVQSFTPRDGFHADYYYLVKASITQFLGSGIPAVNTTENENISIYSPKIIEKII